MNGGDASRIGVKGGCTLFAPARGVSPPLVFLGGGGIIGILGILGIIGILGILGILGNRHNRLDRHNGLDNTARSHIFLKKSACGL